MSSAEQETINGVVISFFSTASSVGKTLISINMAAELARHPDADKQATKPAVAPVEEDFMISHRPSLVDKPDAVTEIDDDFLPSRPTLDVDEFNRINDPSQRRRRRT